MASLTLGGRAFALAPLKLGDLRLAAPHIDALNMVAGALETFEGMMASTRAIIEVLAIAVHKIDATLDADALEAMAEFSDMANMQLALKELMEESGLAKGEAPTSAPTAPATEEVSEVASPA